MGAGLVEETDAPVAGPEGDILAAQQANGLGRAIGHQCFAEGTGDPVALAHEAPHGRIALHFGEGAVLLRGHCAYPLPECAGPMPGPFLHCGISGAVRQGRNARDGG